MKYIPRKQIRKLNTIARKSGKNYVVDSCPVLTFNAPIFLALPNIDSMGWVRCEIPAEPDCSVKVCIDIREEDFAVLPQMPVSEGAVSK